MAAQMSVLGLILSSYQYLRSAMVRFPFQRFVRKIILDLINQLIDYNNTCRTALDKQGLLNITYSCFDIKIIL